MGIRATGEHDSVDITHLAAFLSGAAAIVSAFVSLRLTQKRAKRECDERVAEIKAAFHEGFDMRSQP
jgi:hypothetical protein